MTTRRVIELLVVPLVLTAAFVVPALAWADRLPETIAVHWDFAGEPDRGGSLAGALWLMLAIWGVAWAAVAWALLTGRVGGTEARVVTGSLYWLGAVLAAVWVLGLRTSLDVDEWSAARDLVPWTAFAAMLGALPLAVLGWWLAGGRPSVGSQRGDEVAPLVAPEGRTAVWSGSAANPTLLWIAAVPVAIMVVVTRLVDGAWIGLLLTLLTGVVVATVATRVGATVGPHGLRIALGWLGWPARTIPLEEITDVRVEDVVPLRYGGWGFRLADGTQAYVIRGGPAIRVARRDASAIVVTVDDAERGAAVLAGHLARRTPHDAPPG